MDSCLGLFIFAPLPPIICAPMWNPLIGTPLRMERILKVSCDSAYCAGDEEPTASSSEGAIVKADRDGGLPKELNPQNNENGDSEDNPPSHSIPQHRHDDGKMPPFSCNNVGCEVIEFNLEGSGVERLFQPLK